MNRKVPRDPAVTGGGIARGPVPRGEGDPGAGHVGDRLPAGEGAPPARAGGAPARGRPFPAEAAGVPPARKGLILASLMLAMFMAAIEATIVATAIPAIVADLGGFARYSWVFSLFLLTSATTVPIYGKLADLYGRKPVFLAGSTLFLLGSVLCGTARSMNELVLYRALQGLGAGAVQPVTLTIVGDLYPLEERARVQGYLSSVWGIASITGPAAGGLLVEHAGWPWIFYINVPVGLLAMAGVVLFLHEPRRQGRVYIDYQGSLWMTVAVSALLIQLVEGGSGWPWLSPQTAALLAVAGAAGLLFIRQERRAPDPVLPPGLLARPVIRAANLGGLVGGAIIAGISSTVPTFVQGVLGRTVTVAGFALATMSIGWPLAATVAGRLMLRFGFRPTALAGAVIGVAGALVLLMTGAGSSPLQVAAGSFVIGASMGLAMTTYIVSIQSAVPRHERGVATGSQAFARMLGSATGAALVGAIINGRLAAHLAGHPDLAQWGADAGNLLLDEARRALLDEAQLAVLRGGFADAFHAAMWAVLLLNLLVLPIARMLPAGAGGRGNDRAGQGVA